MMIRTTEEMTTIPLTRTTAITTTYQTSTSTTSTIPTTIPTTITLTDPTMIAETMRKMAILEPTATKERKLKLKSRKVTTTNACRI